ARRELSLAPAAGRMQAGAGGRAVRPGCFPGRGDEPYSYVQAADEPATPAVRKALGLAGSGTRVTVPLALRRLPPNARLRTLVAQLVQLRPVLEDAARELWLDLPGEPVQL